VVNARVPIPRIALEALPSHYNLLKLAELPRAVHEGYEGIARSVEVEELELENHVELLVRGKNVSRELELHRGVHFADGY
jgi:hypothetical protein